MPSIGNQPSESVKRITLYDPATDNYPAGPAGTPDSNQSDGKPGDYTGGQVTNQSDGKPAGYTSATKAPWR